ncbi:hypothetical protein Tco_1066547 [Tanacetum coccineum]|uniref:CCHC-type domain-containing protein n=1 Tax=Tanacetum coccineum TaxID=301880 RepID=A0ABQ5HAD0_9ASTR
MMNTKCNHSKGDMNVKTKSSSSVIRTVLMVDSITFGHEMVNILVSGKEYDIVFNHLDMLNAPFEGKNKGQVNNPRGAGAAGNGGVQNRVGNARPGQARQIKCYNCNGIGHIARNYTQPKRPYNSDYFKDKMLLMQAQENGVVLDEEQLLFLASGYDTAVDEDVDEPPVQDLALNVDNVFQADACDAFDSDVDEALTAQTMFMENLSSADPVYDNYQDAVCEHHEVHEMHDDVQPNCIVDSDAEYTGDNNMILYDQYVKDNAKPVVQNNVSSVPNDAYMMIINEMHDQTAQCVSVKAQNKVVDASLTTELATYKEHVELYERRAKFELTEKEQKSEEQLRIVITDCNIMEENFKRELHSVKMQLNSTINHNKSMPALYDGHEIIKTHHVSTIVHNSEDTLEIAEITRKKMNDKMKTPLWTEQNINIRPLDYSKDNYLATFTPQTQLTPEQIFWSKDVFKIKAKALKEQTKASRPIKALTVYPPNTPATLVPGVLLIKSQVKINIFTLIQLFSEFKKTCEKRITPTGLTKGERGFEQTKECYLTKVNPFFKTLNEYFEGIQKALTKEIKEMKEIFEELEAEVDQNIVNRKYDEIERKNLLIANDNLIADCLAENAKFKKHYKELYDSIKITCAKHIKQTTALLTENENLKAQIHENMKYIIMNSVKPRVLAPGRYAIDVEPIPPRNRNNREVHLDYLKHLKKSVETLHEIVEEAKVKRPLDRSLTSACLYTKHSQELLEYVIDTCPKDFNKQDKKHASTPLTRKKQVTFEDQCETSNNNTHKHVEQLNIQKTNVPVIPSTGVNSCTDASGSKPRSNTKKNRISPAKSVNKKKVKEHPRINKSSLKNTNRVVSSISSKRTIINSNSYSVCKTCNKCLISANHDMCVVNYLHSVNASPSVKNVVRKVKKVWKPKQVKQVWKVTGKLLTNVGYQWKPTGRIFTLGE